jgi:hypothetical protein
VKDRELGLHIDADLVIDSSFGIVHDILVKALGIPQPTLHMHAALRGQDWGKSIEVRHFTIEGTFAGIKVIIYFCDIDDRDADFSISR